MASLAPYLTLMQTKFWQRAALRAGLAAGAAAGGPIRLHGLTMNPVMSALLRFARRMPRDPASGLASLRRQYAAAAGLTGLRRDWRVQAEVLEVAGRPARRYTPPGETLGSMLFFHGGGFIMGSVDTHDALCRRLAMRAGLRIVSIEYRLAPEHPFPAAHDNAAAAFAWAGDALPKPLLVGGDSAGANLAAGLALAGGVRLQVLLYPVVDMLHQDGTYPSIVQFWDGFLLTADGMQECVRLLVPADMDRGGPRLSPIRADLSRAAPALVMTAGFDPLRDQGSAFVAALRDAGREAALLEEPGLLHGFADFAGVVPEARRAVDRLAAAIRRELA